MGISARLRSLLSRAPEGESRRNLIKGVERIMSTESGGMGKLYKFMSMLPRGISHPYAFDKND